MFAIHSNLLNRAAYLRRHHHIILLSILAGGISLVLYLHGVSLWYAPIGIVLIHVAGFATITYLISCLLRRLNSSKHTHSFRGQGYTIHRPRLYDWLFRFMLCGGEAKFRERTLDFANLKPGHSVLDVGCGTGTLLLAAAKRVRPSGALHGIEPAPEMVEHAKNKCEQLNIIEGSADNLPYEDGTFDAVFCTLVLHHLPEQMRETTIREIRRVLREGGHAVIVDMQRAKFVSAVFSIFNILHSSNSKDQDILEIDPLMTELGFQNIVHHSLGTGAIGALVGKLNPQGKSTAG